jgi:hypothetical protein
MNFLLDISLIIFAVTPIFNHRFPVVTLSGLQYNKKPLYRFILDGPYLWFRSVFPSALRITTKPLWVTLIFLILSLRVFDHETLRYYASQLLALTAEPIKMKSESIRNMFTSTPDITLPVNTNHTHGAAAANRSSASMFIGRLASRLGFDAIFVQMSRADQRQHRKGTRSYYWAKDLNVEPSNEPITNNSLIVLVDSDQYVDMPDLLSRNALPVALYTFQPEQTSKDTVEYSYTFDADNVVSYNVSGGGHYSHPVWNYGSDSLIVQQYFFGFPTRTTTYSVERRQTMPDHQIILLTPLSAWGCLFSWFANLVLDGPRLQRLSMHKDGFLRLYVQKKEGLFVSTGIPGAYLSATISVTHDDAIRNLAAVSVTKLNPPQVRSVSSLITMEASTVLTRYHMAKIGDTQNYVYPVEHSIRRYQPDPPKYNPTAKSCLQPFMSPFIDACYAPDRCIQNEAEAVNARVESIKSTVEITPQLHRFMMEFIELLVPVPHQGVPSDYQRVFEMQNRPRQRSLFNRALSTLNPMRVIQSFMKAEAYNGPKPARIISTINPSDKIDYSLYTYSFSDYIKTCEWYAFGKTPALTAECVATICVNSEWVVNSDLSRWDGRYSQVLRELEFMLLMRFFSPEHHEQLLELHSSQYNLKAFTSFGIKYQTDYTRCSGSPETAVFNSMANKFISYIAYRMEYVQGSTTSKYTPSEAYLQKGVYGGDDGLSSNMDLATYYIACNMVGQKLEAEKVLRGQFGVKFLARVYSPDVWFGSPNSCCDLPRQLSKFHATVCLPPNIKPVDKLLEKSRAYFLTDSNTPVLGVFVNKVLSLHGAPVERREELKEMEIWGSHLDKTVQYPNLNDAGWMNYYVGCVLPGLDPDAFAIWVNSCTDLVQLLSPPLLIEPARPVNKGVDAVVNDEIYLGSAQNEFDLSKQVNECLKWYDRYPYWNSHQGEAIVTPAMIEPSYHGMFLCDGKEDDAVFVPLKTKYNFVMECAHARKMLDDLFDARQEHIKDYPMLGASIRPCFIFHVGQCIRNHPVMLRDPQYAKVAYKLVLHERDCQHVLSYVRARLSKEYPNFKINGYPPGKKRYDSEEEIGPKPRVQRDSRPKETKARSQVNTKQPRREPKPKETVVKAPRAPVRDGKKSDTVQVNLGLQPEVTTMSKRVAKTAGGKQPASGSRPSKKDIAAFILSTTTESSLNGSTTTPAVIGTGIGL